MQNPRNRKLVQTRVKYRSQKSRDDEYSPDGDRVYHGPAVHLPTADRKLRPQSLGDDEV